MKIDKPLIFLVEDSDPYRILLQRVLEENGFSVLAFRNGAEAFEQLYNQKPEAIISDLQMPRMDGFELRQATTEAFPERNIPFICITSNTDALSRERADSLGVDDFHLKPLDLNGFMNDLTLLLSKNVA